MKSICNNSYFIDRTRQDNFCYVFAHDTVMTDQAPQVAEGNRGGPGTITINEIC